MLKAELEKQFPKTPIYGKWDLVPRGLVTKTKLKQLKIWRDDLKPVAIICGRGNDTGYYLLYSVADIQTQRVEQLTDQLNELAAALTHLEAAARGLVDGCIENAVEPLRAAAYNARQVLQKQGKF